MDRLISAFLDTNSITSGFLVATLGTLAVCLILRRQPAWRDLDPVAPGLLTSLGVLGTFVGIVLGLLDFDPRNIDKSIDTLLEGLKTAFLTSIVGMISALLYQAITVRRQESVGDSPADASTGDLLRALTENGARLESVKRALAGDEESSLAGQLKLMRSDFRDGQTRQQETLTAIADTVQASRRAVENVNQLVDKRGAEFQAFKAELWLKLTEFAELMSRSATEQVIEALKNVIVDFNRNLTEQFGENFKALDASVKSLVEWQERYRLQLAQMIDQYASGVTAIDATRASVASIEEHSMKIPEHMSRLEEVLTVNQHQIAELSRHLDAFRELRDNAVQAVPEVQKHLESVVQDIGAAAKLSAQHQQEAATQMHKVLADGAEHFENSVTRVNASLQSTSDAVGVNSEKITQTLDDALKDTQNTLRVMVNTLVQESGAVQKSLSESTQSAIKALADTSIAGVKEAEKTREAVASAMDQMRAKLNSSLEEVFRAQNDQMTKILENAAGTMRTAVDATSRRVTEQIGLLDNAMQEELNRTMNELGRNLAHITGRFADDYKGLVARMDEVIRTQSRVA